MKFISLLTLVLFVNFGFSQKNKENELLSGHVFELSKNDSLLPLPGVNVYFLASSLGTVTNSDGFFSIPHYQDYQTLIFSYTGYQTDTLEIKNDKEINVCLLYTSPSPRDS